MIQLSRYFQSRDLAEIYPGVRGKSISSDVPEKYNFEAISKSLAKARETGYGLEEPERGVLYVAWNTATDSYETAIRNGSRLYPHIFSDGMTFRSISPRFEQHHTLLPLTAMHIPASDVLDILFGKLALVVMVNLVCLEIMCRNNSVPLQIEYPPSGSFELVVNSESYRVEVGSGLWYRVVLEGLSLESFCALTERFIEQDVAKAIRVATQEDGQAGVI